MAMARREFLGLLLGAGSLAYANEGGVEPQVFYQEEPKVGFSILQGMTDETSAQFSVVLPKEAQLTVEIRRLDGRPDALTVNSQTHSRIFSDHCVHRVLAEGLELGVTYLLQIRDATGQVHDEREFSALDLSRRSVRLGFVSCALDLLHRDDIWNRLESENPEMLIFLGDNVYADRVSLITKRPADEKQLWQRYVLTRNRVAFYFQKQLRPVIAIWDDHDFGADNGNRTYAHAQVSKMTFETFFAQSPRPALLQGPGIARRFSAFGANFFLLDGRTFRDPHKFLGAKMLGQEQEDWMFGNLEEKPAWLLNGSMFFGAYNNMESFEGPYHGDFQNFLSRLKSSGGLFCFGSGDVHFSEVSKIEREILGYETFELVSSSIHSYAIPGHERRLTNPRRVVATGVHNFVIFEGEFGDREVSGTASSYSADRLEFRESVGASLQK